MPVPQNPKITINFTGRVVFCFDKEHKHCEVGIHTKSDNNHELRVSIVKKQPSPVPASVQSLTISHDLIRQSADLWLDIEGTAPQQQKAEPFITDNPETDPQDFRHVVDLEGEKFYNRSLKLVKDDVFKPSLFIAKGLFYTASRTPQSFKTFPADQPQGSPGEPGMDHPHDPTPTGGSSKSLGRVAEHIGMNIYLDNDDQSVVLRAGKDGPELLRLNNEENTTYEITIENGPTPHSHVGNHFKFFYDAFALNQGESKIFIEPEGPVGQSFEFPPCVGIQLSQSHDLEVDT
jgi:hypothetical protein